MCDVDEFVYFLFGEGVLVGFDESDVFELVFRVSCPS